MLTLALETSSTLGSVAVVRGGANPWDAEVLATAAARVSNAHGESLLTVVEYVLRTVWPERAPHEALAEIELFAVGVGPGSFTGTRIGVATAKGLAVGTGRPLRGVDAFSALAAAVPASAGDRVGLMLDARKSEVYLGVVDVGEDDVVLHEGSLHVPVTEAWTRLSAITAAAGSSRLSGVVGDGLPLAGPPPDGPWPAIVARLGPMLSRPHAAVIAALAASRQRVRPSDEVDDLEPLYVRPPDITLSSRATKIVAPPAEGA